MSVRVLSWVLDCSPVEHRGDLLVLLVLADHAHDDGTSAYPSVETIARKARLSERGARYALRRLEAVGAIQPTGSGPKGTVSYRVNMAEGGQSVPPAATAPGQSATPGGAASAPQGGQSPAPEPSLNRPRNRPHTAHASTREKAANTEGDLSLAERLRKDALDPRVKPWERHKIVQEADREDKRARDARRQRKVPSLDVMMRTWNGRSGDVIEGTCIEDETAA